MTDTLDIIKLVENHPLNRLPINDSSILVNKIKEKFPLNEQQLFVANFYCYLNYDTKKDHVVDLDNIWRWIGFERKGKAKELLVNNFKENEDYIVKKAASPHREAKIDEENRGGHNKETILLTIRCFKKLCLKTKTKKSDEIHEYYLSLEEMINEIVYEQSEQLRNQLQLKDKQIKNVMIEVYNKKPVVYLAKIEENIIKYGSSDNLKERYNTHKREINDNFEIVFILETEYNKELENMIRTEMKKFIISRVYNEKNQTELIQLTETYTLQRLINQIKGLEKILSDKSYVIQLVKENAYLKERLSKYEKVEEESKDEDDKPEHVCLDCGTKIFKKSLRCLSCNGKSSNNIKRKVENRPPLEQLIKEVKETSYLAVGKKYSVSDNCIRKWIKSYDKTIDTSGPHAKQSNPEGKCLECEKDVRKDAIRCTECAQLHKRKDIPPPGQLLKEIDSLSISEVANKHNVTPKTVRKWVKLSLPAGIEPATF